MGMTEDAMVVEARDREDAIERAIKVPVHLAGPRDCVRCQRVNDRRDEGFAVCSGCVSASCMGGARVR